MYGMMLNVCMLSSQWTKTGGVGCVSGCRMSSLNAETIQGFKTSNVGANC